MGDDDVAGHEAWHHHTGIGEEPSLAIELGLPPVDRCIARLTPEPVGERLVGPRQHLEPTCRSRLDRSQRDPEQNVEHAQCLFLAAVDMEVPAHASLGRKAGAGGGELDEIYRRRRLEDLERQGVENGFGNRHELRPAAVPDLPPKLVLRALPPLVRRDGIQVGGSVLGGAQEVDVDGPGDDGVALADELAPVLLVEHGRQNLSVAATLADNASASPALHFACARSPSSSRGRMATKAARANAISTATTPNARPQASGDMPPARSRVQPTANGPTKPPA